SLWRSSSAFRRRVPRCSRLTTPKPFAPTSRDLRRGKSLSCAAASISRSASARRWLSPGRPYPPPCRSPAARRQRRAETIGGSNPASTVRPDRPPGSDPRSLHDHPHQRFQPVCFFGRLVPADAMDAGKAHGDARFVTGRAMHGIEGHLEHELGLDLTDRAKRLHSMVAHEGVEPSELLVGETEIRLAHRHELRLAILAVPPSAERVVGIK